MQEVTPQHVALGVVHENVTAELMLADTSCCEAVLSVARIHPGTVDIDLGLLGRVDRRHDYVGRESLAGIERGLLRDNKRAEFVDADVFHVDIRHQRVKHFTLGIAHIVL